MKPAAYVDIDCDLYDSSLLALDWMFNSSLIVPGTLIGYDDFWVMPCSGGPGGSYVREHPWRTGEWAAHTDIAHKYRVTFSCVAGLCREPTSLDPPTVTDLFYLITPIFLVRSIGEAVDDGVHISKRTMGRIFDSHLGCLGHRNNTVSLKGSLHDKSTATV